MHFSKNAPTTMGYTNPWYRNICGADRDRTDDIQLAKLALSQLSYSPGRNRPGLEANREAEYVMRDS
jgi:hypothetical protein